MTAIARMRTQGSLAATGQSANRVEGRSIDVSLSGTWTGTATLQRYMSDGWQNTEYSWTSNTEATVTFATPRQMRLNYTKVSGTLVYDLVASEDVTGANSTGSNSTNSLISPNADIIGRTTYLASGVSYAAYATPTDLITISGSATKTVVVTAMSMAIGCTSNTLGTISWLKRSTANTGGTASQPTAIPYNSTSAAATAVVNLYSVIPAGLGNSLGLIRNQSSTMTVAGTAPPTQFAISGNAATGSVTIPYQRNAWAGPIILNGVAESLCMNFGGAALPAGFTSSFFVEWIEY